MKKLVTLIITLGSFYYGLAQNTDYYNRTNHVFGNINKSKVTTGPMIKVQ